MKTNAPQKPALQTSKTHIETKDVTEHKEPAANGETSISKMKDADHRGSEQRASGIQAENSLEKIPAGETEETDSVAVDKEKQKLASFWEKLLQKGPKIGKKITSHIKRLFYTLHNTQYIRIAI